MFLSVVRDVCKDSRFHISPDGRYVAVANQELGTLEVFPRENTNGQLGKLLCCVEVPHVSCVKWRNKFLR